MQSYLSPDSDAPAEIFACRILLCEILQERSDLQGNLNANNQTNHFIHCMHLIYHTFQEGGKAVETGLQSALELGTFIFLPEKKLSCLILLP